MVETQAMPDDTQSFRSFYDEALPRVYGYFLHRCGGEVALAEDLTQETFVAAVRDRKVHGDVGSPIAWVLGIARHKLIDHYRAREREERKLEAVAGEEEIAGDLEWPGEESSGIAMLALDRVAASQRAALVLRHVDGFSVPEVARILSRSVHATESLLARGRESFRRSFEEVNRD
jgi:RNA polymerase sigma-70 factor (ECF subfamily)